LSPTRVVSLLCSLLSTPPPPTDVYTLSLHDALPILRRRPPRGSRRALPVREWLLRFRPRREPRRRDAVVAQAVDGTRPAQQRHRSEEHTSELQSPYDLVCRLLLEKKKYVTAYGGMTT